MPSWCLYPGCIGPYSDFTVQRTDGQGPSAGGFQAILATFAGKALEPETGAVALLRMRPASAFVLSAGRAPVPGSVGPNQIGDTSNI